MKNGADLILYKKISGDILSVTLLSEVKKIWRGYEKVFLWSIGRSGDGDACRVPEFQC
jgi:hypothetical protein